MINTGQDVTIYVAGGAPIPFTDEPLLQDTEEPTIYFIKDGNKRLWDKNTPIIIKENGVVVTEQFFISSEYGEIQFEDEKERGELTVSGAYIAKAKLVTAHKITTTEKAEAFEITAFGDKCKKRVFGQSEIEGKINEFGTFDSFLIKSVNFNKPILISIDRGNKKTEKFWAIVESSEMQNAIDAVDDIEVSFKSTSKN